MKIILPILIAVIFQLPFQSFAAGEASIPGNAGHNKLITLPEKERLGALALFLQKSGEVCAIATRAFYQGALDEGDAFWNATCSTGKSYVVRIKPGETSETQIMDCKLLEAIKGGKCFTKF